MPLAVSFWNVGGRNDVADVLAAIVNEYSAELLILAECRHIANERILQALRQAGRRFGERETGCPRLRLFLDRESVKSRLLLSNAYAAFLQIDPAVGPPVLLAAAHLPSKLHCSAEDQREIARRNLSEPISQLEMSLGHERTLLVGDLNMDPFEPAVVSAGNLHGTFSRKIAQAGPRRVLGREYPFFFNPMWRFYATIDERPGSYHRTDSSWTAYFWHMYDQVLVRPSLLPGFPPDDPLIIDSVRGRSLLAENGRPNRRRYSDHLPLVFRLDTVAIEG